MKTSNLFQLKPHEETLEIVHEFFFPRLPRLLLAAIFWLVPFFFAFPLFHEGLWGVVVFFLFLLIASYFFLRAIVRWTGTVLILTDKRIIDIERRGLFDRVVTETPYHLIDEASYRIKGFFPTLLRYGIVSLHISGSAANIEFERMRNPARVHDLINDLREEANASFDDS